MQRLLTIGANLDPAEGVDSQVSEVGRKLALYGALELYLNFVNLFMFLLSIFGGGRD